MWDVYWLQQYDINFAVFIHRLWSNTISNYIKINVPSSCFIVFWCGIGIGRFWSSTDYIATQLLPRVAEISTATNLQSCPFVATNTETISLCMVLLKENMHWTMYCDITISILHCIALTSYSQANEYWKLWIGITLGINCVVFGQYGWAEVIILGYVFV